VAVTTASPARDTLGADKRPAKIAGMFDAIAGRYDLLNHLLSGGLDVYWRMHAVRRLGFTGRERLLDVCTGTADLAIAAMRGRRGPRRAVGVDFAGRMLAQGHHKLVQRDLGDVVDLARADALALPVRSASVDAAAIAFGIRNVSSMEQACGEMYRVLRPGGRLAVLEFGLPRTAPLRRLYLWYFEHVLPRVGRLVSRHHEAYTYLPASVGAFPPAERFVGLLESLGFEHVEHVPMTFGVVSLFLAIRPSRTDAHGAR
jgi:demethylmenaquinone methyltransferase/2-methoxy-6-polyprenyl-1,4-benzoquinol methylase